MSNDVVLREQLHNLLSGSNAHMTFEDATKDFPMDRINDKFSNGSYSAWGLLEHIRITQHDILEFIGNREYQELEWPKDYWPDTNQKATTKDWQHTIQLFNKDLQKLIKLVQDPATDLNFSIPYKGKKLTILRELLVVVDHNSYHIGEFAIMRQVMGTWKTNAG